MLVSIVHIDKDKFFIISELGQHHISPRMHFPTKKTILSMKWSYACNMNIDSCAIFLFFMCHSSPTVQIRSEPSPNTSCFHGQPAPSSGLCPLTPLRCPSCCCQQHLIPALWRPWQWSCLTSQQPLQMCALPLQQWQDRWVHVLVLRLRKDLGWGEWQAWELVLICKWLSFRLTTNELD